MPWRAKTMAKYYSKAQMKATNKHIKANYWRPSIVIPIGKKAAIENFCRRNYGSVNNAIKQLLAAAMKAETVHTDGPTR